MVDERRGVPVGWIAVGVVGGAAMMGGVALMLGLLFTASLRRAEEAEAARAAEAAERAARVAEVQSPVVEAPVAPVGPVMPAEPPAAPLDEAAEEALDPQDGVGSSDDRALGGLRGRPALTPRVRTGSADVRGSLDREVIRRVIRRHLSEVRFCYEQQLHERPELAGRIVVAFIISPTGAVQSSSVTQSTLRNAQVESCVSRRVRGWLFPAPRGGGIVAVSYPFVFSAD